MFLQTMIQTLSNIIDQKVDENMLI